MSKKTVVTNTHGVSITAIVRTGSSYLIPDDNGGDDDDVVELPVNNSVTINNADGFFNSATAYFSIEVNGVMYNADKSQDVTALDAPDLYAKVYMYRGSDGSINFSATGPEKLLVRLSPTVEQKKHSNTYLLGSGDIEADGTFVFILSVPA